MQFSITVSGNKARVLERLAAAKESKVEGHGHPLTEESEALLEWFETYVGGLPDNASVSLSVHALCNYFVPQDGPNVVGA